MSATSAPTAVWVPLDRLVRDPRLQMRAALADGLTDPDTVERYCEELADGKPFPPLEVVSDGAACWLVDGFQRAAALERLGKGSAECVVYPGNFTEALLRALSANARHGLTRTPQDCRRALATLLDAPELLHKVLAGAGGRGGVYRALAATCGVSKGLLYKVLEERGMHAIGGTLQKKHVGEVATAESAEAKMQPCSAAIPDATDATGPVPTSSAVVTAPHATGPIHDLDRAASAIRTVWAVCRALLDGPLSARFLRIAATHSIPFCRSRDPTAPLSAGEPLSTQAWWEPLGRIEAVFADLYALALESEP